MAPPPDEERTMSPRKVKGRREGVGGAIEEGVVDDRGHSRLRGQSWHMKPPQHLVWERGWGLVWRARCARAVVSTSATIRSGTLAYRLGQRGSAFGSLLMATALLGDCRMPAAVLLVAQARKSDVMLLVSQSPAIDPDKEEAAVEPYEDGLGSRLFSLGSKFGRPLSLGDALADEAKALAKCSSLPLPFSLGDALADEAKALAKQR